MSLIIINPFGNFGTDPLPGGADKILLESGDALLLESGDNILLE